MNSISTIGILYSYAPHFTQAVQYLHQSYPNARIIAFVPPSFPKEAISAYVAKQIPCVPEPQSPKTLRQSWHLLQEIRTHSLDLFVVLFKSSRLQTVAALSGASESCCYNLSGNLVPIRLQLLHSFIHSIAGRIRGQLLYWRIWINVHCTTISPKPLKGASQTPKETPTPSNTQGKHHA
ncbi:MAG: hypothetical protein KAH38_11415 [Candidatus Hydrogenedentes bacterium]|nr:hypothetical protein [Candidatus Hydrogenedentota bacterium]